MKILAVDTALGACSTGVVEDETIFAHACEPMERGHAERLAPMVREGMEAAQLEFAALERLAVTIGPGTFTGQRVGLAFMRGLRLALKRPLIGVTTLSVMADQAMAETGAALAIGLHDARREEIYIELSGTPMVLAFENAVVALRALPKGGTLALAGTAAPRMAQALDDRKIVLSTVRQPD